MSTHAPHQAKNTAAPTTNPAAPAALSPCHPDFTLRPAGPADEPRVRALMQLAGMGFAHDWMNATVAVDESDQAIGYIRIQATAKGPHVAPVAVFEQWQGRGVGRALMQDALAHFGMLKLVARGDIAGFYRSLGCEEIPFDEISDELEEDCEHCPDRPLCRPVAFVLEGEACHA